MASLRITLIALAILGITISPAWAIDHIVGDDKGWTLNFNYQEWASNKQFFVGDRIIFNFPVGVHNVVKVDKTGFQQCKGPTSFRTLVVGKETEVISLKTPGIKWYICTVGNHCNLGMKLAIKVWDKSEAPTPAPAPSSGGYWY